MVVGDGRKGYEAEGPYDAIHVGAAADELPRQLCKADFLTVELARSSYIAPFSTSRDVHARPHNAWSRHAWPRCLRQPCAQQALHGN